MRASTMFDIQVAGILSRHQFTRAPAPVVDEVAELGPVEKVSWSVGAWVGYYDSPDRAALVDALRARFPGSVEHEHVGRAARGVPIHGTEGFLNPHVSGEV